MSKKESNGSLSMRIITSDNIPTGYVVYINGSPDSYPEDTYAFEHFENLMAWLRVKLEML